MKRFFWILILSLPIGSCTTLNYQINVGQFKEAYQLAKKGEVEKAKTSFEELCKQKHKVSCLMINEEVGWYAGLAIMQGASLDKKAKFVIASEENDHLEIFAINKTNGKWIWPDKRLVNRPEYAKSSLIHVEFNNLSKNDDYQLVVSNHRTELLDFRNFKTLNSEGSKLSFAVISCMRDDLKSTEDIWMDLENMTTDVILMIGDTSYLDIGLRDQVLEMTAKRIWQRHMETRTRLRVFRWKNLVPVFATWDDHDYGKNNGDKSFSLKEDSEKIFQTFFIPGIDNKYIPHGPGVSFAFKLRGQNFIFLDNRSFRDGPKNKSGYHFGVKQNQWMGEQLSRDNLNWLISGDQFFGSYHKFESFQGQHPEAFKAFLSKLKETRNKYVFLSGDRHLSEVMKIPAGILGYSTLEITSSPMHSSVYPGAIEQAKNTYRIHGVDGNWNFVFVTVENKNNKFYLEYESRGAGNLSFFRDEFEIKL